MPSEPFDEQFAHVRRWVNSDTHDREREAGFLAGGVPLEAPEGRPDPVGPLLAGLSGGEQSVVTERTGHVREVLTGYRSETAEAARPGESRPTTTRPGFLAVAEIGGPYCMRDLQRSHYG